MSLSDDERKSLRNSCTHRLHLFSEPSPAELFHAMGDWCSTNAVEHDVYGEGALISGFERKIAALLGKPAALFVPSGTMAQMIALRIWTERRHLDRVGLHVSSHLENHEEQAYQALFHLHAVKIGSRLRAIQSRDLENVKEPLACLIVELPMRELGGILPTWDELEALKAVARERGVPLHLDGARLWESRAYYARSHAQIVDGFDSVYVSMYKGIGAVAGALLAGSEELVESARVWRRRMGGTLVHQSPMVISAAMQFDARIGMLDACYERARSLAAALAGSPGIRILPAEPQSNMMHICFDAQPAELLDARDRLAQQEGVWLFGFAEPAEVPGWSRTELYVGDTLLELPDAVTTPLFERLMAHVRSGCTTP